MDKGTSKDIASNALDALSSCDNYTNWLYELALPYIGFEVIEIGSGLGTLSTPLVNNTELTSIFLSDSEPERVATLEAKFQSERVKVVNWTLPAAPPPEITEEVDTVVMWNVLEHIQDDAKALSQIMKILKPGGYMVAFVPACQTLMSKLDCSLGHYRRYFLSELSKKSAELGFETVKEHWVNFLGFFGWLFNARILGRRSLPSTQSGLFDKLVPALKRIERYVKIPFGLSILFVARKPLG